MSFGVCALATWHFDCIQICFKMSNRLPQYLKELSPGGEEEGGRDAISLQCSLHTPSELPSNSLVILTLVQQLDNGVVALHSWMNDYAYETLINPNHSTTFFTIPIFSHLDGVMHQHGNGHGSNAPWNGGEIPSNVGNLHTSQYHLIENGHIY